MNEPLVKGRLGESVGAATEGVSDAPPASPVPTIPLSTIFLVFLRIGLISFGGGVSAWVFREVVIRHKWLTRGEFFSGVAVAQILPGTNISNLTVLTGHRLRGLSGAFVAFSGLLVGPFFAVLALLYAYGFIAKYDLTQEVLEGIAASAIGLMLMMAGESARASCRHVPSLVAFLATFVAVGLLRWPLVPVVMAVGALSVLAAALRKSA